MIHVGIGEYAISNKENESIITHALGTCVAVIFYCPMNKTAALAHIVLPENSVTREGLQLDSNIDKPSFYATEIIPLLVNYFEINMRCRGSNMKIHIIGGAESKDEKDYFKIGTRNVEAIRRLIRHYQLHIVQEETGGHVSRTVAIDINTGSVTIKRQNMII